MLRVNLSPSPKDLEKKAASSVPGLLSPKKLLLLSKRFRKKKQKNKKTERPIADDAIIITYQR
jgi:hypothetical protein